MLEVRQVLSIGFCLENTEMSLIKKRILTVTKRKRGKIKKSVNKATVVNTEIVVHQ